MIVDVCSCDLTTLSSRSLKTFIIFLAYSLTASISTATFLMTTSGQSYLTFYNGGSIGLLFYYSVSVCCSFIFLLLVGRCSVVFCFCADCLVFRFANETVDRSTYQSVCSFSFLTSCSTLFAPLFPLFLGSKWNAYL